MSETNESAPQKDEEAQHPVPDVWRGVLREVVRRLVAADFALRTPVVGVAPVSSETANQMQRYVADYGAALVDLPEEPWDTSVSQWYGSHWDVLVDLWTSDEGRSDLVLFCNVRQCDAGYIITLESIHVP